MDKLGRLEAKVDKLNEVNSEQNLTLAKMAVLFENQQEILKEHMRRSESNEKHIHVVEKTLEKHLHFIRGIIWIAGVFCTSLIAVLGVIVKLLK